MMCIKYLEPCLVHNKCLLFFSASLIIVEGWGGEGGGRGVQDGEHM